MNHIIGQNSISWMMSWMMAMPAQRAGGRTAAADSGFLRTAAQLRAVRGL